MAQPMNYFDASTCHRSLGPLPRWSAVLRGELRRLGYPDEAHVRARCAAVPCCARTISVLAILTRPVDTGLSSVSTGAADDLAMSPLSPGA